MLVPGQVEDDASIRLGAGEICTNLALLHCARARHPEAFLVYKPHPDVEAGLRAGRIEAATLVDQAPARRWTRLGLGAAAASLALALLILGVGVGDGP